VSDAPDMDLANNAAEIAHLATLNELDYDRERKGAAERLGIRLSTLDAEVERARPTPDAPTGRSLILPEAKPWPETVNAAGLLDAIVEAIRRHVILRPEAVVAIALWIAHTYVYELFQHTPRLSVTSPLKRCGKSTLLDVLRTLSYRPLKADNISASGVFRTVEALRPFTLLVDETDSFLANNEELRGVLNSGFEASGEVVRVVEVKGEHQPVRFATFAPVALAGIGTLPSTLEDRSVPIVLQRKGSTEAVQKLRAPDARAALDVLARKLVRWAADRRRHLSLDPLVPEAMGDREGDISVPLLAIADDAGGDWPKRGRDALLALFGRRNSEEGDGDTSALLLTDVRSIFLEMSALRLFSADIVSRPGAMESRPWPELRNGKAITAPQLARALAPFGI
jgi:hypothetical protein